MLNLSVTASALTEAHLAARVFGISSEHMEAHSKVIAHGIHSQVLAR